MEFLIGVFLAKTQTSPKKITDGIKINATTSETMSIITFKCETDSRKPGKTNRYLLVYNNYNICAILAYKSFSRRCPFHPTVKTFYRENHASVTKNPYNGQCS